MLPKPQQPPTWVDDTWTWKTLLTHKLVEFDGLSLFFSRRILNPHVKRAAAQLAQLRAKREQADTDTCVVVGNGPSLNDVDWESLDEVDIFASNYAYLHDALRPRITYLSVTNPWVVSQAEQDFHDWSGWLFMPYYLAYWVAPSDQHLLLDFEFGHNPAESVQDKFSTRSTVSYFNLQLALCLGYKRILLVGFDHLYQQPADTPEGTVLQADSTDPNHFSPDYFARKQWQAADLDNMNYVYAIVAEAAQRKDVAITNCSTKTKLKLFPLDTLESALQERPQPTSIDQQAGQDTNNNIQLRAARLGNDLHTHLHRTELIAACLSLISAIILANALTSAPLAVLFVLAFTLTLAIGVVALVVRRRRELTQTERTTQVLTRLAKLAVKN